MSSCREKKDAEISSLEVERNKELEELRELEQGNQSIRDKMDDMARQYNRCLLNYTILSSKDALLSTSDDYLIKKLLIYVRCHYHSI